MQENFQGRIVLQAEVVSHDIKRIQHENGTKIQMAYKLLQ